MRGERATFSLMFCIASLTRMLSDNQVAESALLHHWCSKRRGTGRRSSARPRAVGRFFCTSSPSLFNARVNYFHLYTHTAISRPNCISLPPSASRSLAAALRIPASWPLREHCSAAPPPSSARARTEHLACLRLQHIEHPSPPLFSHTPALCQQPPLLHPAGGYTRKTRRPAAPPSPRITYPRASCTSSTRSKPSWTLSIWRYISHTFRPVLQPHELPSPRSGEPAPPCYPTKVDDAKEGGQASPHSSTCARKLHNIHTDKHGSLTPAARNRCRTLAAAADPCTRWTSSRCASRA
jgi:hypothetical protein